MISPCLSIIGSCDTKIQFKGILNMYCSLTVFPIYPAKAETKAYNISIDILKKVLVFKFFFRIQFRLATYELFIIVQNQWRKKL